MKLTLNVGCGDRTFDEYPAGHKCINYDIRSDLQHVDVFGDARDLSIFEDEIFSYILASDIIEHFKILEVDSILKEWLRVLKPGGIVEFRLPNLEAIVTDYLNRKKENRNDMPGVPISHHFNWLLGGGQDYEYNVHYTFYDRSLFKYVCEKNGLQEVTWKKDGYNMVTTYRKL